MAKAQPNPKFPTFDKALATDWISNTSGYDILDPAFFENILHPHTIKALTRNHAGGSGKYAVTKDGSLLKQCVGVSEFDAVDCLADLLGVEPCRMYLGRGKNFRETVSRILTALK